MSDLAAYGTGKNAAEVLAALPRTQGESQTPPLVAAIRTQTGDRVGRYHAGPPDLTEVRSRIGPVERIQHRLQLRHILVVYGHDVVNGWPVLRGQHKNAHSLNVGALTRQRRTGRWT